MHSSSLQRFLALTLTECKKHWGMWTNGFVRQKNSNGLLGRKKLLLTSLTLLHLWMPHSPLCPLPVYVPLPHIPDPCWHVISYISNLSHRQSGALIHFFLCALSPFFEFNTQIKVRRRNWLEDKRSGHSSQESLTAEVIGEDISGRLIFVLTCFLNNFEATVWQLCDTSLTHLWQNFGEDIQVGSLLSGLVLSLLNRYNTAFHSGPVVFA